MEEERNRENGVPRKVAISEEDARRLLAEEKARLEQGWKKAETRRRRVLVIAIVIAVVVCLVGLVMVLMTRNK